MPITAISLWKSRRREKLIEAFNSEYCGRGMPYDWSDFCESEFAKYLSGEIPHNKYVSRQTEQS